MKHNLKIPVLISEMKGQELASFALVYLHLDAWTLPHRFFPGLPFFLRFRARHSWPQFAPQILAVGALFASVRHLTQL